MARKSFLFAAILVSACLVLVVRTGAVSTRTVYVAATDNKGNAVTDLQPAEFEVKVGGKKLDIVRAERAEMPMRIALLVSDAGTGGFQAGLSTFIEKLSGRAEFALISVLVQPQIVVDYTSERSALQAGVRRLGPRGLERGAQLLETIRHAAQQVRREATRPVIIVVRVGGEGSTTLSGRDVREELRKSGAILYVISTVGAQRQAPSHARPGLSTEQAQLHDDEEVESALNLGLVLGDGSRESGGHHAQVLSTTLIPTLAQIADELLNQYALTCVLPDGVKSTDRLSVSSKRKNVRVRAPSRLTSY